ncbi:hypothetical protein PQU92_00995 [Asticcacaulis sp. BYS171W]|uniref:HEAT repeat domain-containing protein n=1 Tax=Asticcacaulis aquaticus TaxID=2984212 RepID=A0ABT5HPC3_9CAUL|nr:hypothetical protein [Asticcacaulis aquaticus]MDC7681834.1 hypothetical protein [Asticcacaulis aquaticus]
MSTLKQLLPPELVLCLNRIADQLDDGRVDRYDLATALTLMDVLPIKNFERLRRDINSEARLWSWRQRPRQKPWYRFWGVPSEFSLLSKYPDLAWLFLFHSDGFLREAALKRIAQPRHSAFFIAILARRLNDWVGPVRLTARFCAGRIFPLLKAEDIAEAATGFAEEMLTWGRQADLSDLENLLNRSDVVAALAARIKSAGDGRAARLLRAIVRRSGFDSQLPDIALKAAQPSVRAMALGWLIDRRIFWPDWSAPMQKRWIDKSSGLYRLIHLRCERVIDTDMSAESLIASGLSDRSVMVRKTAMWSFLDRKEVWATHPEILNLMEKDSHSSLREAAAYIRNNAFT